MRRLFLTLICVVWAASAVAQSTEDDRDFLTGLIEDAVSNDNMTVRLINFQGALSSEATADSITIADPDGVWLQLDDLTFAWSRSALLSGRVEVETLSAERIELIRLPSPAAAQDDLPTAEAQPFSLPDLPVSVNIDEVSATEIILTEALLGEPVRARFEGSLTLADGAGDADLLLDRIDSKTGRFEVDATYQNESRQLALLLEAEEGPNGIAARLLNLPDRPAVSLSVTGDAPLDNFAAQIALATDGTDRITGAVTLSQPSGTIDRAFGVDLRGDLRPLLASQYHPFFGASTVLRTQGTVFGMGGLRLTDLTLAADQLVLRGSARLDAQSWPEAIDLRGRLGTGDGNRVLLPIGGASTEVSGMSLNIQYDANDGNEWTGAFDITSLTREGITIDALALSGGGIFVPGAGATDGRFTADMTYAARGLALDDAALSEAIGTDIEGTLAARRTEGSAFALDRLTFLGAGIEGLLRATIEGPDDRFRTQAFLDVEAEEFERFSALAGLDLTGAGEISAQGQAQPFDGIFDASITATTDDLGVGIAQIDPLLRGEAMVAIDVERDTQGTRIPRLQVTSDAVTASGSASLTSTTAQANIEAALRDVALIQPGLNGPARLSADVSTDESGAITLDVTANAPDATVTLDGVARPIEGGYDVAAQADGSVNDLSAYGELIGQRLTGGLSMALDGTYATTSGALSAVVTARTRDIGIGTTVVDRVLAGLGRIDADVSLSDAGRLRLDALDLAFPNLSANGTVASSGADTMADLSVRLRDIALLVSDFSGPVTADITARQDSAGWQVTGAADGPVGTNANVTGRVANSGSLDLDVSGSAPLAFANLYIAPRQINGLATFDLSVDGPAALTSVRGPVSIQNARFAAPTLGQAIENLNGTLLLAGGTLRVDLGGTSAAGGQIAVSGPIDLQAPYQAGLRAELRDIVVRDPELYQTTANGAITVQGPLAGGAAIAGVIDLGQVDVQVPSTGVSALGSLPEVTHLGPRLDVRQTLARAGVTEAQSSTQTPEQSSAGGFPVDLTIRAPSRIFVRGRGLDAELGGQLQLTGTTNNIIPIGRFDLVRGRLSILGQRFELDEGFAQLQGDFSPFLRLVATTEAASGTLVSIIVEGEADDIDVRFDSSPELPQDEILAQLLFGRDLSSISPLQAVQLASAVATLAGSGNGGVVGSFREDLDLDDLDIITDDDGNAAVRAGKYLSENVYTDVTVGAGGTTEINLNIDIDRNFTARGSVASDGETSIGIFFERDY